MGSHMANGKISEHPFVPRRKKNAHDTVVWAITRHGGAHQLRTISGKYILKGMDLRINLKDMEYDR